MIRATIIPVRGKIKRVHIMGGSKIFHKIIPISPGDYKAPGIIEIVVNLVGNGIFSYHGKTGSLIEMYIKNGWWKETLISVETTESDVIEDAPSCDLTLKYIA